MTFMTGHPDDFGGMVRGFTWKVKMENGAVFFFWTPEAITYRQAKEELLNVANGGPDRNIYDKSYILHIWKTKGY